MIYLILSILSSTIIFLIFNLFERYKVSNLQAINVNYTIAAIMGFSKVSLSIQTAEVFTMPWFYSALLLGFVFVTIFNFMAQTSREWGVSVASVASKLSVAVPVTAAFFLYNDAITITKVSGIFLALLGVYWASLKPETHRAPHARMWLPIAVFIGSGFIDTFMKVNQHFWLTAEFEPLFLSIIFSVAGLVGLGSLAYSNQLQHFKWKNVAWGIALGIPNYFSMEFLLKALGEGTFESSVVFPLNNIGIVLCSSLLAWLLLKEHFTTINRIGIAVAAIAIGLISLG